MVVLCHSVGAGGGSSFDLPGVQSNCEVRDGGVFCFARAVRCDRSPTCTLTKLNGFDGFAQRTDLIHFNEQCICGVFCNRLADALWVGYQKIITNDLAFITDGFHHQFPGVPVILSEAVFDGNNGVILDPLSPELNHLFASQFLTFLAEVILLGLLIVKFGSSRVKRDGNLLSAASLEASFFDRSEDQFKGFVVCFESRSVAAFITNESAVAFFL